MSEHVRVVVIGGGAVGASCLYHLALMGWSDALLIEQNELTSGSTWHAAGNVPTYSSSLTLLKLQDYSASLYRRLGAEVDYPINYHVVGALRLAHTDERMAEFRHIAAMAALNGMAFDILAPDEIPEKHPFIGLDDLKGALWDPYDGDIDPAQLTQALAKGARDLGARVQRFTRVIGLEQLASGDWKVTTDKGEIIAGVVVNAAGYRAGEVMALLGRHLPIVAMQHQYLVTEDVPELAGRATRLPLMRDPDVSYYMRQERGGFILGPYEWDARPMWLDGLPADFSFQLWNDDLDRVAPVVEAIIERVPILASAGIRKVVNGPIPYSPDGNPYIGPEHELTNFFHCNTFSFGIAQAGGAGKCLAEWVVEGRPEWDLWSLDRRRYTGYADQAFTVAKAVEVYQNEYAPAFPNEERPAGRPQRTSPTYPLLKERGAVFGMRGGWERAVYFDVDGVAPVPSLSFARRRNWFDLVGREVEAVRTAAGLIELAGLTRLEVGGPGAAAFLDRLLASPLPPVGRAGLGYALDAAGGILSEFLVVRRAEDAFLLTAAAAAEWHDDDLLRHALPADGSVTLRVASLTETLLALAGPKAREVLSRLTEADLSNDGFPWLGARTIHVAGIEVLAVRTSYVGELGWELHVRNGDAVALYRALLEAGEASGLREFGLYALESLRLDKGYRGWKTDIETGFTPYEASLGWAVDLGKPDFIGKAALLEGGMQQPRQVLVPFLLDEAGEADAPAAAPVFVAGQRAGMVTSGGWSYTLGRSIGLAIVPQEAAARGTAIVIEIYGRRCPATIGAEPMFDPANERAQA
ncbi:FAD-dependent oxidoreductase [Ancylobacter sp. 6x-1]|uniref:FAD-dependent oxidoreductase n=1 Tax=Ancylobacter crimeensis TaxID=2579147 RepID=A0ABT0DCF6_9HYPH|nr:FAD-dependent oxidoreductase [Ancylobacter crimeensis]MCK0197432.1 FAD-dependent oxidoreductase [Ancylobacter crimeensis]